MNWLRPWVIGLFVTCCPLFVLSQHIPVGLAINPDDAPSFTPNGRGILFHLIEKNPKRAVILSPNPTIWSSADRSLKLSRGEGTSSFLCMYDLERDTVLRIEKERESYSTENIMSANRYFLVSRRRGPEWWWRPEQAAHVRLVSVAENGNTIFEKDIRYNDEFYGQLSPDEGFLVFYDPYLRNYCSFETATHVTRNITGTIPASWEVSSRSQHPDPIFGHTRRPIGFAGWLKDGSRVLIYDDWDIWAFDPKGKLKPVNITKGYGKLHNVRLRITHKYDNNDRVAANFAGTLDGTERLILQGVNAQTMEAGLYSIKLDSVASPRVLLKGSYNNGSALGVKKALGADAWIVSKGSSSDAPNLFFTRDWNSYTRISDLQPQKGYNWYSPELVNWRLPNGTDCQGILFKPEDFDSTKKYPVIFNYYESRSSGLYRYFEPEWMSGADINIPFFVSRGYLVFLPDIPIQVGHPGKSAVDAVVSAVSALSRRKYVDKAHMGLIGHSYGGYETNYIVTHSKLFAAAVEGAGPSDFISGYGAMDNGGNPFQWLYEIGQSRIGASLWEKPNLYIENSPIFFADRVSTPILILHNKLDDAVPFLQGIEWFTALRRLGKPAWMLQYEGEGHGLGNLINQRDFTLKALGFFDHWLKGGPVPEWMMVFETF